MVVTNQARVLWLGGLSKIGVTPAGGGRAGAAKISARASSEDMVDSIQGPMVDHDPFNQRHKTPWEHAGNGCTSSRNWLHVGLAITHIPK